MIKKLYLLPIASAAILVIVGFTIFGIDSFNQSEIITQKDSNQTPHDIIVEPITTHVLSEDSQAKVNMVEVIPSYSESYNVSPTIENNEPSKLQGFLIQSAYAITPVQLTVTVDEWTVPTAASQPNAITTDSSGNVWFTEPFSGANNIARLEPGSNTITEWAIPTAANGLGGIITDNGNVWFVEFGGNKIGRLVPGTNAFTEWTIPTAASAPTSISISGGGDVWFAELNGLKIGRLDPTTDIITEWTVPNGGDPLGISVDSSGDVWFTENFAHKIGKLDPGTNMITEWEIPQPGGQIRPAGVVADNGNIWFVESEADGNKVGRLVPGTNTITEWDIPTADSKPFVVAIDGDGSVWFTEFQGEKVGRLVPGTNIITEWDLPSTGSVRGLATDGGDVWFTEGNANKVGRMS